MKGATLGREPPRQAVLGAVCVATIALVALIPTVPSVAMPAMAVRFAGAGNGRFFAQMVMITGALAQTIGAPLVGAIADRVGRRVCLLACLLGFALSGASVLLVNDATSLIALRVIMGLTGGGLWTITLAVIGDSFQLRAREQLLGFVSGTCAFGAAAVLVAGGALVDWGGWRTPFVLYLLALPMFALVWLFVRPRARDALEHHVSDAGSCRRVTSLGSLLPATPYFVLLVLFMVASNVPYLQTGFVLNDRGITSATIQGSIIALAPVVSGFCNLFYGFLRRWLSPQGVLSLSGFCFGAGIIIVAYAQSAEMIMLGCLIIGIGMGTFEPASCSVIFDRTPSSVHALAMGFNVCALNLGTFVHPFIVTILQGTFGLLTALAIVGGVLLAVGLAMAMIKGDQSMPTTA